MSILPTISYKRRNTTAKSINTPISDKSGKETPMNSAKLTFASPISKITTSFQDNPYVPIL